MLTFLYLNDFVCVASDTELEFFALGVANDWFTLNDSARFVRTRAFRMSWSEDRYTRWVAAHTPSDRMAIYLLLEEDRFTATRLPAAVGDQIRLLREAFATGG